MTSTTRISELIKDLSTRSGRAMVSQLGLRSAVLREHLAGLYSREPGQPGALLADPVLEGAFGWKLADVDMGGLGAAGLLSEELVSAMDNPPRIYREHAFPRSRKPFEHQRECWKLLLDEVPRSVLVSSGTGSGKTECFLVPILEDLVRERTTSGYLDGVRALFLYPLNALINSQRERLRAWCSAFGPAIRFCLYNGETRNTVPTHEQARAGAEQLSRTALRANPAPLLVTNSTMLEYMLVRTEDRPILEKSSGGLRWIVLDEAHTYIGSQAAEIALLLRRVMHGFDVDPSTVRFVATSATIGGADSVTELRRFLADVSGARLDRVHVVTGERFVPDLAARLPEAASIDIADEPDSGLYNALCRHTPARALRAALASGPAKISDLRRRVGLSTDETTALLEKSCVARDGDDVFLPLRVHLFHRAQGGLWACVNRECRGPSRVRSEGGWGFGSLFVERRTRCQHCDYPVFELVACSECGQHYLTAEETVSADEGAQKLVPPSGPPDIDEFELDVDTDEEEPVDPPGFSTAIRRLVCGGDSEEFALEDWRIDTHSTLTPDGEGVAVALAPLVAGLVCIRCGAKDRRRLFRELRIGAPFALSTIVPTALAHTPPKGGSGLPSDGRRLLGFTDSRQGSARLAVRLQQEAERNRVRSVLYHALAATRATVDTTKLEADVEALRVALRNSDSPGLRSILEDKERELADIGTASQVGALSWNDAVNALLGDSSLRAMHRAFRYVTGTAQSEREFANFCLYREFFSPTEADELGRDDGDDFASVPGVGGSGTASGLAAGSRGLGSLPEAGRRLLPPGHQRCRRRGRLPPVDGCAGA